MNDDKLPFSRPLLGDEEIDEVVAVLRSGWLTSGPRVHRFEREFASYVGSEHAAAVSSCTAALHLALLAHGIGPGDEVVTTPITGPPPRTASSWSARGRCSPTSIPARSS